MNQDEDVSLFIGCLPGRQERQVLLFPEGHTLAHIPEQDIDIEIPAVGGVQDHGWIAACALIQTLTNGGGWYIEEVTEDGNGWWLKPRSKPDGSPSSIIKRLDVRPPPDGVDP